MATITEISKPISYWRDPMSEEMARRVLGSSHFDWIVEQGEKACASRAAGSWQANLPESYGAYRTAERVAAARAEQQRDYGATVLDIFDGMQREQLSVAAEVHRKARNQL
ncbi:hypothetical protein [Burkholderia gladioli]|uniref:hypothetical protein n=1 Tax=Burkholderia gladioli TaxID=28095 RepID=UPI0016413DC1|nr:hypothetical protein [Burkholderia gladioli]